MMAPFDSSGPSQQQQGVAQASLPRPPMPPGGNGSPGMHQQQMNPAYMHRQGSGGMAPPGQPYMSSQSPAGRQNSFSMPNQGPQGHYSSHPPLHSPAHQQGGMHPHQQMHRNSVNMPSMPNQHDQMRMSSSQRGSFNMGGNPMNGGAMGNMGNNMNMGGMNMNNPMGNNAMGNHMGNSMGGSMGGMNMNNQMGNMNAMNNAMPANMNGGVNAPMQQHPPLNGGGNAGLNGNWQSEDDTPHRREMIQNIVKMLKKDKKGSPEWLIKLPHMAKQLEVSLYKNARSFEAYSDISTLKSRLQQIAVEVSAKASSRNMQDSSSQRSSSQYNSGMRQESGSSGYMGMSSQGQQNRMSANRSSQIVNMDQINPMSSGGSSTATDMATSSGYRGSQQGSSTSTTMAQQNRNDPEYKIRIRHKQQRLLLLHHSAKCPHEDGRCTVTPHCADMKRLWRHMEGCKDNQCRVSHCFSSRAILSHYRKCKEPNCPACGPVRDTVKQSNSSRQRGSSHLQQQQGLSIGSSGIDSSAPNQASMQNSFSQSNSMPTSSANQGMQQFSMNQSRTSGSFRQGSSSQVQSNSSQNMFSGSSSLAAPSDLTTTAQVGNEPKKRDTEWQKIRHKQQRLLLLRHASRCKYEPSKCPVTPHCANMKKLWAHITDCRTHQCTVPHCMSSRYVLSHYRRCKDARCPACGPVRDSIKKSNERERNQSGSTSFDNGPSLSVDPTSIGPGGITSSGSTSPTFSHQNKRMKTEPTSSGPVGSGFGMGASTQADVSKSKSSPRPEVASSGSRATEDSSLLNSFTIDQLTVHLASLNRATQLAPTKLKSKCSEVLKGLQTHQHGWVFNVPVDPVELGLPDYFDVIKKPMDLGTVAKRLDAGQYHSIEDFKRDVSLTFDNAMTYNETGSVVYDMADELKRKFEADYEKMMRQLDAEDQERRANDRACTLCGCEKLLFEPPVFFCNGMNCQSKRIRRNSHFYIGGNNQYFWCNQCYNELDESIPIELIDCTIQKNDLVKKKNDEQHEESWVQCDSCERWIHQICGLFNTRQNKEHHSEYCCPNCLLERRKKRGDFPAKKPPMAEDLPRTKLSEALENHVARRIAERKRELVDEKVTKENVSNEEALKLYEEAGSIIIRQVTSMDRKHEVRELMKKRYEHKKYPDEFPFRCKCIVVFQHIDGVDVVLFALYVYEHGEDNPAPNQRCVYISYLDSVHFMRPRKLRTFVYHEILIAYIEYVRQRGFATAHIWACPPLKGDDYIFYCKPEDQKTPRDSRLRQWYIDLLTECQKRSIVGKVTNMYDLYFANEKLDATAVPYLEGDYFPGEAENIIKMLEEGVGKKKGGSGKNKKKQSKNKSRGGTRSTGVDEEALLASGMMDGIKDLSELDRDQVMVKLGETIQPMKDSFIVAYLNWSGAKEEDLEVPDDIKKYREENPALQIPVQSGSKRDADGKTDDEKGPVDKNGRPVKVIDDDAEDLDCEFLNNRQAFLNLCRGNHYQFDELRRAKHTSMMVLWHLHNRDAPKFVQQCVACNREILSGKRYHCNTCPDYDLCETCYRDPKTNRGACNHKLQPLAVENENNQDGGSGSSGLTAAERKQRQRNLNLHIQLIEHAARCDSSSCTSTNCAKMKNYIAHAQTCRTKAQGGCRICKRIWTLLRFHAQRCKEKVCPIPQCMAIREKMRQLQKQQQAMDDRRRLAMNGFYRSSMTAGAQ